MKQLPNSGGCLSARGSETSGSLDPEPRPAPPMSGLASNEAQASDEDSAMLAFIDELARLAADLWLEGYLDDFATIEDPTDPDD